MDTNSFILRIIFQAHQLTMNLGKSIRLELALAPSMGGERG
jgi:hypothetical protein